MIALYDFLSIPESILEWESDFFSSHFSPVLKVVKALSLCQF